MDTDQAPYPSGSPRASIVVRDSIELWQPAMTPPASNVQTPLRTSHLPTNAQQHAPTSQISMQHIITIEHGNNLSSWRTIHESELLREKYDKCKDISNQLGSIASVDMSPERFEARKLELSSLMATVEKYPIQEYQKSLDKVVSECMDRQFTHKNYLQSGERPKNLKSFQALSLKNRLSFLNAEGALSTAEATWMQLQKVMNMEKQKAQTNVVKAWAQGRLLVPGASENSVLSLVEWAYLPALPGLSPERLYDLWNLATRLGLEGLAEECMARLFNSAHVSINNAISSCTPLRDLLGLSDEQNTPHSPGPSNDVVATVFRHVLKDDNPPKKLSELVIETIARGVDQELWSQLSPMVNHDTARKVIEAMIAYRQVKAEQHVDKADTIKQESQRGARSIGIQVTGAREPDAGYV
ncbi:hypothetical protein SVAN01_03002 [Stagonosporopsis vannaccii]|nr:hypothetical protein SVAN01_03002 [Stagonosporopsis vannaccii]